MSSSGQSRDDRRPMARVFTVSNWPFLSKWTGETIVLGRRKRGGGGERQPSDLWSEFANNTTLHGLRRAATVSTYKLRRAIWALALICMCIALFVSMYDLFLAYNTYPSFTSTTVGIASELDFPAITVCNLSPHDGEKVLHDEKTKNYYLRLTPLRELAHAINWSEPEMADFNKQLTLEWLYNSSFRLEELLYRCLWDSTLISCSDIFKTRLTDFGVCFTFNDVKLMGKLGIMKTRRTGSMSGLLLNIHIYQERYIYNEPISAGIKVVLHHPYEEPDVKNQGFLVSPGFSTYVHLHRIMYKFLPSPYKAFGETDCVDTTSEQFVSPLRHFDNYSHTACLRECRTEFLLEHCGCQAVTDPGNRTFCSRREISTCYKEWKEIFEYSISTQNNCGCVYPCEITSYDAQLSFAYYPAFVYSDLLHDINETYLRKNLIELRIFYDSLLFREILQVAKYTFLDILGILGGQMGLFLGASILTVSELVEFIISFAVIKCRKCS